jgi:hypothetical protein
LLNHYVQYKIAIEDVCFGKCDEDFKCAAACLTYPDTCRLFKYGFDRADEITGATAYIKPEVTAELAIDLSTLNETYPAIKPNTRPVNFYDTFDALTPSQCFKQCKMSRMCAAASFTSDNKYLNNCYLIKSDSFKESDDRDLIESWTSYVKAALVNPMKTTSATSTTTTTTTTTSEHSIQNIEK